MKSLHARIRLFSMRRPRLALVAEVLALTTFCFLCDALSRALHLPIPGSVLALGLLLALLASHAVRLASLRRGADWLLAEMLLFFIPAVMAVSQHTALLRAEGVRIVAVILLGTVLVMASSALLVDLAWRWGKRHAR